jgi:cytochrome c553
MALHVEGSERHEVVVKRFVVLAAVGAIGFALGVSNERRAVARRASVNAELTQPQFKDEPLWAYGVNTVPQPSDTAPPQAPPTRNLRSNEDPVEQTRPRHVEGSGASYSLVDVRDSGHVIDWFPGDHPPMPSVVQRGPVAIGETTRGCASCHLPNGKGRPENAPVAGLPAAYFLRQIQDFRNGLRHTADPRKPNTPTMITLATAMTDAEVADAAAYFGAIAYDTPWVRVIESATVPRTKIVANLFIPLERATSEPINGRIIEVPENEEQSELERNPHSGFVAYVPPGSLALGKDLATTGGMRIVGPQVIAGRATACITCHGVDLRGVESVPPIAGRSPSYLARQLWDIQQGTRNGPGVQLMKAAIAHLTPQDIVGLAAYAASRPPR